MRSRSSAIVILALCACNQAFELRETRRIDAQLFDVATDAPFTCPPLGTAPRFTREFRQTVFQNCDEYSVSTTSHQAMAYCHGQPDYIADGPLDSPLSPAVGLQGDATTGYSHPQLGPDGDVAVATVYSRVTSNTKVSLFRRTPSGWRFDSDIVTPPLVMGVSSPTRGDPMRVLAWTNTGLHEIVADGAGGWTDIPHAFSELGVTSANTFGSELSPDGLRLVLVAAPAGGGTRMLYADRPSPGAPFSKVQPIEDLQYLANGFMTEDCGRVYFTTLSSVFYVPRD